MTFSLDSRPLLRPPILPTRGRAPAREPATATSVAPAAGAATSIIAASPIIVGLVETVALTIAGIVLLDGEAALVLGGAVLVRNLRTPAVRLVTRPLDGLAQSQGDLVVVFGLAALVLGDVITDRSGTIGALVAIAAAARTAANVGVMAVRRRRRPARVVVVGPSSETRPLVATFEGLPDLGVEARSCRGDRAGQEAEGDATVLTASMRRRPDFLRVAQRSTGAPVFLTADSPAAPGCVETVWSHRIQPLPVPVHRRPSWVLRSWCERAIALAALVVAAPLLGALALCVRRSGPGPVLFRQERIGLDGRTFTILKLRSLPVTHRDDGWNAAASAQPTRVGRIMRDLSLDELPQLWNVVRGDMSLVGPRPELPHYVREFEQRVDGYRTRHRVPVGLTGWAQAHGLRGDTSLDDRVRFDNNYIDDWSVRRDLFILLRTMRQVLPQRFRPVPLPAFDDTVIDLGTVRPAARVAPACDADGVAGG